MHNVSNDKELGSLAVSDRNRAPAFSLAELIVSMGILLLMLALAGQVMTLTVNATGQANAVTEVNQSLRIFERTLRDDLKYVKPDQSLLLIEGNPINAYWTADEKEADNNADPGDGFPVRTEVPRADTLMFFTVRRAVNYVQYDYSSGTTAAPGPIVSGIQQVVYGHAELADLDSAGAIVAGYPQFPTDPTTVWLTPAEEWHLARRIVHLLDLTTPPPPAVPEWIDGRSDLPKDSVGNQAILEGLTDVVTGFDYEARVLQPSTLGTIGDPPLYWPEIFADTNYPPHARSVLDETPPARFANRLGHYFMPNCASFKVEWAIDRKSEFVGGLLDDEKEIYWIDPGAERPLGVFNDVIENSSDVNQVNNLTDLLTGLGGNNGAGSGYSLTARFGANATGGPADVYWHGHNFTDGTRPNLHVFGQRLDSSDELVPDELFPVALRITIEMKDENKRLERPTRHVMIVPVGG